ncbi:MAG TPA: hypothetical protein VEI51_01470 [Methanomicrobiales archaeon]|nr:hypothetical protein [Methanomicrobiales archaeon]
MDGITRVGTGRDHPGTVPAGSSQTGLLSKLAGAFGDFWTIVPPVLAAAAVIHQPLARALSPRSSGNPAS